MGIENFNFFIILSGIASAVVLLFTIYVLINRRKKKGVACFIIFSIVNIIVSNATFITLSTINFKIAHAYSQVLMVALFIAPVALMCYTITSLETELSKVNKFFRLLLYTPSIILSIVVLVTRSVSVVKGKYGYTLYSPNLAIVDMFYFITIYLIIIIIIRYEIHKNIKLKISNKPAIILLSGLILYFVGNAIYYSLLMSGFYEKLPTQSIYLFVLYIFTAVTMLIIRKKDPGGASC